MAIGWRVLSVFGTAFLYQNAFQFYNAKTYGPIVSAFFRKYQDYAHADRFKITDRKREFYEIDTTQYMNYDFKDLGPECHVNHGPQPVILKDYLNMTIIGWRGNGQLMVLIGR